MMFQTWLIVLEVILGVLLCTAILLQAQGSGLGVSFGGEGNVYRTKRGIEKKLQHATIALAVLFFGVAFTHILV